MLHGQLHKMLINLFMYTLVSMTAISHINMSRDDVRREQHVTSGELFNYKLVLTISNCHRQVHKNANIFTESFKALTNIFLHGKGNEI